MIPRRLHWIALPLLMGLGAACVADPSGTDGKFRAAVNLQPVLPEAVDGAGFTLAVDRVRLRFIRSTLEVAFDTVAVFPADSNRIALRIAVPLRSRTERLTAVLEMMEGSQLLFSGSRNIDMTEGGDPQVEAVPVDYVGPGANITKIEIAPHDTVLSLGTTFAFRVLASTGTGIVPPPYYVSWTTSDVNVPVGASGDLSAPDTRGAIFLRVRTPSGAKDSTRVIFSPPATALRRLSGDGQSGMVGTFLPTSLVVQALANDGLPVPGVRVSWTTTSGGAFSANVTITDEIGLARVTARLGTIAGDQHFQAEVSPTISTSFLMHSSPEPPSQLIKFAGDLQTAPAGNPLPLPLSARVLDPHGNPVPGARVDWSVSSGGGLLSSSFSTTDQLGFATVDFTLGPTVGSQQVQASIPNTLLIRFFNATATP